MAEQKRETLDVESPANRQDRLGNLLSSISTPTSPSQGTPGFPPLPPQMYNMPESSVLARARAFLPQMAASNQELLEKAKLDPSSVDIENTANDDKVVAMDVNLGVFDVKGAEAGDFGPEVHMDGRGADCSSQQDDSEESDSSSESDSALSIKSDS